ncbi:MAG: spore cortex biosynthesis protein YabQ [Ruminococcus sp.]|nr:spore cortex biosynthesis protein YabQ [Ruminococcus sp.]
MEFTLSQQSTCFLWSIACGIFIAIVYDAFRILRLFIAKNKVGVFLCDFLFVVISALASVVFSIAFSLGNTRYFIVLGEILGFSLYRFTVGRITVRVFEFLFVKLSAFLRKTSDKIRKIGKKVLQLAGTVLYNIIRIVSLLSEKVKFRRGKSEYETATAKEQK